MPLPWNGAVVRDMLRITAKTDATGTLFELEGKLAGPWVRELSDCWKRSVDDRQRVKVVLKAVMFIDAAGKELLAEMRRQGADLVAEGCMTKAIIDEIERGERT
jgi:hypothetical protein